MGKEVHLIVAFLSLIANLVLLIPFYLKRHHYLINYNGFKLNFSICVLTAVTMFFNSVIIFIMLDYSFRIIIIILIIIIIIIIFFVFMLPI